MIRKTLIALALLCLPSLSFAQDAGVGLLPMWEYDICPSGLSTAGACTAAFTNLSTTVTAASPAAPKLLQLSKFHQVQVEIQMNVAVVTGDVVIQCDADSAFGSPQILLQHSISTGTATQWTGWYDMTVADECTAAAGAYVRLALDEGNGSEDPRVAYALLQFQ